MMKRAAELVLLAVLSFGSGYLVRDTSARGESREHQEFVQSVRELKDIKGAPMRMYDHINQIIRKSNANKGVGTLPTRENLQSIKTRRPAAN